VNRRRAFTRHYLTDDVLHAPSKVWAAQSVFVAERVCYFAWRAHNLPTLSATDVRSESNRSAYTSSVIAALACPSMRATTFGFAPALIANEAAEHER
jgi:hypothetical protein